MNELKLPEIQRSYRYKKELVKESEIKQRSGRPKKKNRLLTHSVLDPKVNFSIPELPRYSIPSKYEPWMCDKAIEVMANGGYEAAVCVALGICKKTYKHYLEEYPEFAAAIDLAKVQSESRVEKLANDMAEGKLRGNVIALMSILNNKCGWSQKPNDTANSNTTNNINILVQNQSREQLIKSIEGYLNRSPELLPQLTEEVKKQEYIDTEIEIVESDAS